MRRSRFARIGVAVIIAAISVAPALDARANDLPKGTVVVARVAPAAVLMWDASAAVGDLVIAQQTGAAATAALEADAIDILVAHASRLSAKTIEIHVGYLATGVVGAAYQASTFANATPLLTLAADRSIVATRAAAWKSDIAHGRTPRDLDVHVTGTISGAP